MEEKAIKENILDNSIEKLSEIDKVIDNSVDNALEVMMPSTEIKNEISDANQERDNHIDEDNAKVRIVNRKSSRIRNNHMKEGQYKDMNIAMKFNGTRDIMSMKYSIGKMNEDLYIGNNDRPRNSDNINNCLANSTVKMGLRKVKVGSCLYVKNGVDKKDKVSAGIHVEDILISAIIKDLDIFDSDIKKIYVVTSNRQGV